MHILLSNDDGYLAPGLAAMYDALCSLACVTQVTVVAPEQNCSGASNSLTLSRPLSVSSAPNGFRFVNGTPTDCVHIALTGLMQTRPDLVVSGINNGQNMGDDTLYSGTVAAATEGYLFDVPAMAFSLVHRGWGHLQDAARAAGDIVQAWCAKPLATAPGGSAATLLNINIPNLPYAALGTWRVTRLGKRHPSQPVIRQEDPHGQPIYWIGPIGEEKDASEGTDFHAVNQGWISMTPLQLDLTHLPLMAPLSDWATRSVQTSRPDSDA